MVAAVPPEGGVRTMPEIVAVVVPDPVAYSTGKPPMPSIAVLPIAEPDHDGLATGATAAPDIFRLNVMTVPSCRVRLKFWPLEEVAVVLLYDEKSIQQYDCQSLGPVDPCDVGG